MLSAGGILPNKILAREYLISPRRERRAAVFGACFPRTATINLEKSSFSMLSVYEIRWLATVFCLPGVGLYSDWS